MKTFLFYENNTKLKNLDKSVDFDYTVSNTDYPIEHTHRDYWDFSIVLQGEVTNYCNGKATTYGKNELFYCTHKDVHYVKNDTKQKISFLNVSVRLSRLKELATAFSPRLYNALENKQLNAKFSDERIFRIQNVIQQAMLVDVLDVQAYNDYFTSAFVLILQHLFATMLDTTINKQHWLIDLYNYLQTTDSLTCSVTDLCVQLGYSKTHLARLFEKDLNTSPHYYLLTHKLKYAENMLKNTDINVSAIARQIGYTSLAQFNVNFKAIYGITPSNYRKLYANKDDTL